MKIAFIITDNEAKMIENIALNEYTPLNGGTPESADDTVCWADCLECGPNHFNSTSIPGIVSSLVKKELVWTDGEQIQLTEKGFSVFTS